MLVPQGRKAYNGSTIILTIFVSLDTYSKGVAICVATGIATDIAITTRIAIHMVLVVYPDVFGGVEGASPSPRNTPLIDSLWGVCR